jgi:hypothetical protein
LAPHFKVRSDHPRNAVRSLQTVLDACFAAVFRVAAFSPVSFVALRRHKKHRQALEIIDQVRPNH